MGMMESVVGIVLTVILFLIIGYIFIKMFGVPTCASLANQTALELKFAIDKVAADDFPTYRENNVPTDPAYYEKVPIRLCNQYLTSDIKIPGTDITLPGYAYFLQFFGGMPEYQIYYEQFPESGFVWNEAYPWSGGAASSFLFWGVMRGVTWIAPKLTNVWASYKATQLAVKGLGITEKRATSFWRYLVNREFFEELIAEKIDEFVKVERLFSTLTSKLGIEDSTRLLKYLGDAGLIEYTIDPVTGAFKFYTVTDAAGNVKLVLPDTDVPSTIVIKKPDPFVPGGYIEEVNEFAVYQPNHGGVFDPAKADFNDVKILKPGEMPADPDNYIKPTINPRKQMEIIYNELKDTQPLRAREILEHFALDDTGKSLTDDVTKPSWIQKLYNLKNGVGKRIGNFKDYLKRNFYLDDKFTIQTGNEIWHRTTALNDIVNLPDNAIIATLSDGTDVTAKNFREIIIKPLLESKDLGFADKIRYYGSLFGIDIGPEVTPEKAAKVLNRLWDEYGGGFAFYHESDLTNVFVRIKDAITQTQGGTVGIPPAYAGDFSGFVLEEYIKKMPDDVLFNKYFKAYEDAGRITNLINMLHSDYWDIVNANPAATEDVIKELFSVQLEKRQLSNLVRELMETEKGLYANNNAIREMIEQQLGMTVGIFSKDYNAMPVSLWKAFGAKYVGKEARKMLFIDGTAFVAPNSWIGKGIILGQMTERCEGNSICLYVHASQYESPYYLSENATQYFVRVWRPVEPWKQFAGWQAALMHVPEHPRFYVVSPCFAIAKVWKTNLNGEDTIFVYPIKVDMGDNSSNYCYADENLINTYTAIWAAADFATVAEIVLTFGTKTVGKKFLESAFGSVWNKLDPITLIQVGAEAAISWPGSPYRDLNYTDMNSEAGQAAFGDLEKQLKP